MDWSNIARSECKCLKAVAAPAMVGGGGAAVPVAAAAGPAMASGGGTAAPVAAGLGPFNFDVLLDALLDPGLGAKAYEGELKYPAARFICTSSPNY